MNEAGLDQCGQWYILVEELLQFANLTIRQGIHRIHNNRLRAFPASALKDVIHNGYDIRQALPRTCAGR